MTIGCINCYCLNQFIVYKFFDCCYAFFSRPFTLLPLSNFSTVIVYIVMVPVYTVLPFTVSFSSLNVHASFFFFFFLFSNVHTSFVFFFFFSLFPDLSSLPLPSTLFFLLFPPSLSPPLHAASPSPFLLPPPWPLAASSVSATIST